jgi:hypothetical protein
MSHGTPGQIKKPLNCQRFSKKPARVSVRIKLSGRNLGSVGGFGILRRFFGAKLKGQHVMHSSYLGIDFGTSNCTAGRLSLSRQPELLALEAGSSYLSSALYLPWPESYDVDDDTQKKPSLAQLLRQPQMARPHMTATAPTLSAVFLSARPSRCWVQDSIRCKLSSTSKCVV